MSNQPTADAWHLHHVEMTIELDPARVVTHAIAHLTRLPGGDIDELVLDGRGLELLTLTVDGEPRQPADGDVTDRSLRVRLGAGNHHTVGYTVAAVPGGPQDSGFTVRPQLLSTNCEPTGFRRITYFLDRPANRATFDVTLVGNPASYPVMLSNGDLHSSGTYDDGRVWARFVDPISKPSYLFAVVAGVLSTVSADHTTITGRAIELRVVASPALIDGAEFALRTMTQAMAYDEANGGIEHDLDVLSFVAIPGYPDATEYHGLMFFDASILVADTRGHVDDDLMIIAANIAHEYGHHVRGNRITVRSWDQLALKEGLTVLTAQNDFRRHWLGPVARVLDVLDLRRLQFPEEVTIGAPVLRGEVANPEQLYTRTTYLKGAEIFGMLRNVLGAKRWRGVFGEFLRRFDLGSAGVDDFVELAQELAPELAADIEGVARWFYLAGRPALRITTKQEGATVTVRVQRTDQLADDPPVTIPVVLGFHLLDGTITTVRVAGAPCATHLLMVTSRDQTFTAAAEGPIIVSALRGYSAPVDLAIDAPLAHLVALMTGDDDPFIRWWASEALMIQVIDALRAGEVVAAGSALAALIEGLRFVIDHEHDPALLAQLLALPDEFMLGDREPLIDVDGVAGALATLRREVGLALHDSLLGVLAQHSTDDPVGTASSDIAQRMLVEPCLGYLLATGSPQAVAAAERELASPSPTRAVRALGQLAHCDDVPLEKYLAETYQRWSGAPKILDRWLRAQSGSRRADTVARVGALVAGELYDRADRGRVMAIWFPFCTRNRGVFHDPSGAGYRLFIDEVAVLMPLNPSLVIRLVGDLLQFQRFDDGRRSLMRAELTRMADIPGTPDFAVGIVRHLLAQ